MIKKQFPYSALFVDANLREYFKILSKFAHPHNRPALHQSLEETFLRDPKKEGLLATLCVRSSWDLFLQAAAFPKGSEIIMTSINIPDMVTVVTAHGHVPVPINVDFKTLSPKLEDIEAAITPKTKAIMLSYVFGVQYPVEEIVALCRKHNIFVVEDLAECFYDTKYNGHPEADLSLFSFGTIKYNTALGGGLCVVKNDDVLYRKMKHILEQYPMQPTSVYFKKCLKTSLVMMLANSLHVNSIARAISDSVGFNLGEFGVTLVRGFAKDGEFLEKFRFQVSTPMLANLAERMRLFNSKEFAEYTKRLTDLQDNLVKSEIEVPGYTVQGRHFWLFPIVVPDVKVCYKMLLDAGIDTYLGATQLKVTPAPSGSGKKDTKETSEFFDRILYLPMHKKLTKAQFEELSERVAAIINKYKALHTKAKL